jgi:hypothetical protein
MHALRVATRAIIDGCFNLMTPSRFNRRGKESRDQSPTDQGPGDSIKVRFLLSGTYRCLSGPHQAKTSVDTVTTTIW